MEEFAEFSLAEALAHGAVEINDRQSWLVGNVSRPCLVIQIDVWDTDSNLDRSHQENQNWTRGRIWGEVEFFVIMLSGKGFNNFIR